MVSSLVGALALASSAAVNLGWNGFDVLCDGDVSSTALNSYLLSAGDYALNGHVDDDSDDVSVFIHYGDSSLRVDYSVNSSPYLQSVVFNSSGVLVLDEALFLLDGSGSFNFTCIYIDYLYDVIDIDLSSLDLCPWGYYFAVLYSPYCSIDDYPNVLPVGIYSFTSYDFGILTYDPYVLASDNPVSAISDGLGVVGVLGKSLNDGFNSLAWNESNQSLTAVMTFGFLLMGIGISFGVVKKCFNWVTGRHGM